MRKDAANREMTRLEKLMDDKLAHKQKMVARQYDAAKELAINRKRQQAKAARESRQQEKADTEATKKAEEESARKAKEAADAAKKAEEVAAAKKAAVEAAAKKAEQAAAAKKAAEEAEAKKAEEAAAAAKKADEAEAKKAEEAAAAKKAAEEEARRAAGAKSQSLVQPSAPSVGHDAPSVAGSTVSTDIDASKSTSDGPSERIPEDKTTDQPEEEEEDGSKTPVPEAVGQDIEMEGSPVAEDYVPPRDYEIRQHELQHDLEGDFTAIFGDDEPIISSATTSGTLTRSRSSKKSSVPKKFRHTPLEFPAFDSTTADDERSEPAGERSTRSRSAQSKRGSSKRSHTGAKKRSETESRKPTTEERLDRIESFLETLTKVKSSFSLHFSLVVSHNQEK